MSFFQVLTLFNPQKDIKMQVGLLSGLIREAIQKKCPCYSTCLSHSSLKTWWDKALKPQYEDTYDVFEGVPSHLVLGN